jgi:serine/threonine-protein kinase mTOR
LILKHLAINSPTAFYAKTSISGYGASNEFLDLIAPVLCDPQPIVRACAADALSQCLKILVVRQHSSLTALLCHLHFSLMDGLKQQSNANRAPKAIAETEQSNHGFLLAVTCFIQRTRDFVLPRFDEICEAVLAFTDHPKALIRLEVIRLIPRLGQRCPSVFGRRYLESGLLFLVKSASNPLPSRVGVDIRPPAFTALGQLICSMNDPISGRLIGGSPSPTVKILNSTSTDPNSASVIIETSKTGVIFEKLGQMFGLVRSGLRLFSSGRDGDADVRTAALYTAADLVAALKGMAEPYLQELIDDMFRSGLSKQLIDCLQSISLSMPSLQAEIEDRLLQEISICLAGASSAENICEPLTFHGKGGRSDTLIPWNVACRDTLNRRVGRPFTTYLNVKDVPFDGKYSINGNEATIENGHVRINMSDDPNIVSNLVLCLCTLGSFGENTGRVKIKGNLLSILPFVRDVVSHYLNHPSSEVRRAAALTCCALLIPLDFQETESAEARPIRQDEIHAARKRCLGSHSGTVVEEVLKKLIQVTISDPSPALRLRVVQALDERYDYFLCQGHHIQMLFFFIQDESLATRSMGLQLLGRLTRLNPAPIIPVMRKILADLLIELRCGRAREGSIRLLMIFLRAEPLQRLIHPVLASIVEALPLRGVAPRLATASLEALGELAKASGYALKPWVKDIIPHIMETMQDQSSATKQRISLRTLGQVAGATGYVVRPYLDYPLLLPQATDVLPGTKRAPWILRREVIRTLGIVGALDPDQYHSFAEKTRKGGAVGGGYFAEREDKFQGEGLVRDDFPGKLDEEHDQNPNKVLSSTTPLVSCEFADYVKDADDEMSAHLYMYEQYAMVAQPVSRMVPIQRMSPADEDFYPTVVIQALTRIFKDPSLAGHHINVMQAIMFIFNFLGQKCVPFLSKVVPHMLVTIRCCNANLREALLKQVAALSCIVREHLRPYAPDIFDIVDELWDTRHLGTILSLVTKISTGVPDDFRTFVPRLVRRLLASIDGVHPSNWVASNERDGLPSQNSSEYDQLVLILRNVKSLRDVLADYLHLMVPGLLKLVDSLIVTTSADDKVQVKFNKAAIETLKTLSHYLDQVPCSSWADANTDASPTACSLSSRATQPLIRLLSKGYIPSTEVGLAIIDSLCVCAKQLGKFLWMSLYHNAVRNAIVAWERSYREKVIGMEQGGSGRKVGLEIYDELVRDFQESRSESLDFAFRRSARHLRQDISTDMKRSDEPFGDALTFVPIADSTFDQTHHDLQGNPSIQPVLNQTLQYRVNETALSLSWDVSQKASRDDWSEWMRRFALQLLREAPSPALRTTASLAYVYQPLARELFSAAFVCCWEELSDQYKRDLVQALETAFVADVPPEILQTLLNLAEFMEHDGVGSGLPIDISNLAELALKCRSYAKALHYKEREYNQGGYGSGPCVEALISINKKLDLPEAALGVLKASHLQIDQEERFSRDSYGSFSDHISSQFLKNNYREELMYSVVACSNFHANSNCGTGISEIRESWLSKLGSWSEALQIYEQKRQRNPHDFDAILGSMRCLDASGEWQRVLNLAEISWSAISCSGGMGGDNQQTPCISPKAHRKFLKFGAQAAWRLGDWNILEKYASALVHGDFGESRSASAAKQVSRTSESFLRLDFDGSFFTAVIHIHRKQWIQAATAIDAARQAMDGRFTALMAESYKRAYSGMISAMMLAELEEIMEFRKLESRAIASSHRHPVNRPNVEEARSRLLAVWRDRLAGCRVDADVHSQIMSVRSLILGPTDEVQSILLLSDLSKQAQMFKLAERVLLDPLDKLGANLNGPIFGYGIPPALDAKATQVDGIGHKAIDKLVTASACEILPAYGPLHEKYSAEILVEAGGLER